MVIPVRHKWVCNCVYSSYSCYIIFISLLVVLVPVVGSSLFLYICVSIGTTLGGAVCLTGVTLRSDMVSIMVLGGVDVYCIG